MVRPKKNTHYVSTFTKTVYLFSPVWLIHRAHSTSQIKSFFRDAPHHSLRTPCDTLAKDLWDINSDATDLESKPTMFEFNTSIHYPFLMLTAQAQLLNTNSTRELKKNFPACGIELWSLFAQFLQPTLHVLISKRQLWSNPRYISRSSSCARHSSSQTLHPIPDPNRTKINRH